MHNLYIFLAVLILGIAILFTINAHSRLSTECLMQQHLVILKAQTETLSVAKENAKKLDILLNIATNSVNHDLTK